MDPKDTRPPELLAMLAKYQERQWSPPAPGPLARGDLRWATGKDGPRIVLVTRVYGDYAEVALCHPYVEYACEFDAVVSREVSGSRWGLVVQGDLRGVVWNHQLATLAGRIDEADFAEINRVTAEGDLSPDDIRCGLRLAGIVDPRWQFKTEEGTVFRHLTGDCIGVLLVE